jgi:hypothetical protein
VAGVVSAAGKRVGLMTATAFDCLIIFRQPREYILDDPSFSHASDAAELVSRCGRSRGGVTVLLSEN